MTDRQREMKSEHIERKPWAPLELKVLDVPKNTNNGAGRLQPGEGINFYRNS